MLTEANMKRGQKLQLLTSVKLVWLERMVVVQTFGSFDDMEEIEFDINQIKLLLDEDNSG